MKSSFELSKTWDALGRVLDPALHRAALERHIGTATKINAMVMRKRVREYIKYGVATADGQGGVAPLTAMIKGGKKPIVGTPGADLFNSITHQAVDWKTALVGAMRTSGTANVAKIVHEGAAVRVTEKMRHMFWLLWMVDRGKIPSEQLQGRAREIYEMAGAKRSKNRFFLPIKPDTKVIVIPSRPYLRVVFESQDAHDEVMKNWSDAFQQMITELARSEGAQ